MIRSVGRIAAAVLDGRHYRAAFNMARTVRPFWRVFSAYVTEGGKYPMDVVVRTPIGPRSVQLYSWHDVLTLNEIFCRHDYPANARTRVVVDLGANIGLSMLWFLTRNPSVRVYGYEPMAKNVERLRRTLAGLEDRYEVQQVAVSDEAGVVRFRHEATGRYGGIDSADWRGVTDHEFLGTIEVRCVDVRDVIERVSGPIDVLKVDIENVERRVLSAIRPDQLARIGRIYVEEHTPSHDLLPQFTMRRYGIISQFAH